MHLQRALKALLCATCLVLGGTAGGADLTGTVTYTGQLPQRAKVPITCDLHSWMKSWVVVAEHPYYAVTDAAGAFRIAAVPPGKYRLRMWHEVLGDVSREVEVGPQGAAATFDIKTLKAPVQ